MTVKVDWSQPEMYMVGESAAVIEKFEVGKRVLTNVAKYISEHFNVQKLGPQSFATSNCAGAPYMAQTVNEDLLLVINIENNPAQGYYAAAAGCMLAS